MSISKKIKTMSRDELVKIISKSKTLKEALRTIGYDGRSSGIYKIFREKITSENIDLSDLSNRRKDFWKETLLNVNKIPDKEFFINGKHRNGTRIKKRLVDGGIRENVCSVCGMTPIWNGKDLSLQVDHINGNNKDNRIENLRLICPNCHSQTETFCGKGRKSEKKSRKILCGCGNEMSHTSKVCQKCFFEYKKKDRKFNPTKLDLKHVLDEMNWNYSAVGRYYNVSDNAIRKRCKKYGLVA